MHTSEICSVKFNLLSIFTPSTFILSVEDIVVYWTFIAKWKWFPDIGKCGNLPCLPISMIRFSDITMLIYQYRKNQPIYRYRNSSCWFTNIGQLGHLLIWKYNLHFTEMDKQSCAHTRVSSPWTQFLAVQLKTFGGNILKAPRCNLYTYFGRGLDAGWLQVITKLNVVCNYWIPDTWKPIMLQNNQFQPHDTLSAAQWTDCS